VIGLGVIRVRPTPAGKYTVLWNARRSTEEVDPEEWTSEVLMDEGQVYLRQYGGDRRPGRETRSANDRWGGLVNSPARPVYANLSCKVSVAIRLVIQAVANGNGATVKE
jgi:hypothetical protein